MKAILKKYLSLVLAVLMMLSSAYTFGAAYAQGNLADGVYSVKTDLMKATNIDELSMSDPSLAERGNLEVVDGKWYLIVAFKTMYMGTIPGNASEVMYYRDGLDGTLKAAEVLSYRTDGAGKQQVEKVKIPVTAGARGVYLNVFVDAMAIKTDVYLAFGDFVPVIGDAEKVDDSEQTNDAISSATHSAGGDVAETDDDDATETEQVSETLSDGKHRAVFSMKNAADITKPSMAAAAINENGTLEIVDGKWYLVVEFKSLQMGAMTGDASEIKYYDAGLDSTLHDAKVVDYRTDANGVQQVKVVKIPVAVNAKGVFINMNIAAMGRTADAYLEVKLAAPETQPKTYTLTSSAGAHGTIMPTGATVVTAGAIQIYAITPNQGYRVADVRVDGNSVGAVESYTVENVDADHTIVAEFEKANSISNPNDPADNPEDNSFVIFAKLKKVPQITEDSMSAPSLNERAEIEVVDGQWYLKATFQPMYFMGTVGYAEDIKYYQSGPGSTLIDAEVLSTYPGEDGEEKPAMVKIPVAAESEGVYINAYIDAMDRDADVYIAFQKDPFEEEPIDDNHTGDGAQPNGSDDDDDDDPADKSSKRTSTTGDKKDVETTTEVEKALKPSEWVYSDVSPQRNYYNAVETLTQKGLFKGTGDGLFMPYSVVNRAMLVTLLYRLAGQPAVEQAQVFDDVALNQWYSDAVAWAKLNDIVKGYSEMMFGPQDVLTKEQIVTILYRYQKMVGKLDNATVDLMGYADYAMVSSYAQPAMAWAVANDMIKLDDYGRLNPQENVTRAAMALLLDWIID